MGNFGHHHAASDGTFFPGRNDLLRSLSFLPRVPLMKSKKQNTLPHLHQNCGHAHDVEPTAPLLLLAVMQNILEENKNLREGYHRLLRQTKLALAKILELKDGYTFGHSMRVMQYSMLIGRSMGLDAENLANLELSALFHDLGKIGVADCVLLKPERLTPQENRQMQMHAKFSAEILELIDEFRPALLGALHHHERYDGSGYPSNLKSDAIPLFSRIILVADAYDAMTSTRPYRKALPMAHAYAELRKYSGIQFDPEIVEHFFAAHGKLMEPETTQDQEQSNLQPLRKAA